MNACRRLALFVSLLMAAPASAADWQVPADHPRLFIHRDEVAAMRVRCGNERYRDDPAAKALGITFGSQREVLDRLKGAADRIMAGRARTDDLFAPAVLHLATGELDQADAYTHYVVKELLEPDRKLFELDAMVALDYCWDAIDPESRRRIVDRLPLRPEPLGPATSPVDHLRLYRQLCALASAIVLYDAKDARENPAGSAPLEAALNAGRDYIEGPLAEFCRRRGAMPTSGEQGAWEEADCVLAFELLRSGLGRNRWPDLSDTLGRSMEHYFYAQTDYPGLEYGFVHDDSGDLPARPGQIYKGFIPAVPFCLARNTRDPIATWYADRSLPRLSEMIPQVERYAWVRLVYGPLDQPEAARRACPLGRDLGGGWVAMRSGWLPGDTVLLFDAGQPHWRSRQHFDAGQFQIRRKGRLAIDAGDDVAFEAVSSKGGRVVLGGEPGDWEQFYRATIAHNCVTVADPGRPQKLYDRPWLALGNQRLIERDYEPAAGSLSEAGRETGQLEAFETNSFFSFAAADLTAAYPPEVVRKMHRSILMLNAGAVLVMDRIQAGEKSRKTWHLQLPAQPRVLVGQTSPDGVTATRPAGATAPSPHEAGPGPVGARQVHGAARDAGIWQMAPGQEWLEVADLDGKLFVRTVWPPNASRRLIGGPMRPRQVAAGPFAGRTYFGGDPLGFEHRLLPASVVDAPNVAFELGRPTRLGPQVGVGAGWGRLDVSPPSGGEDTALLHLLIPADAAQALPPEVRFEESDGRAVLELTLREQRIRVELSLVDDPAGSVSIADAATGRVLFEKDLAQDVQPNLKIPGGRAAVSAP